VLIILNTIKHHLVIILDTNLQP